MKHINVSKHKEDSKLKSKIKKGFLILPVMPAMLVALLLLPANALAIQAVPSDDTFVQVSSSNNNGDKDSLRVGDAGKYKSFIKFDLSTLPTLPDGGNNIEKATLKLYLNKLSKLGSFDLHRVDGSWTEGSLTGIGGP